MEEVSDELKGIRDRPAAYGEDASGADSGTIKAQLTGIAAGIETLSGAPRVDRAASRAAEARRASTRRQRP